MNKWVKKQESSDDNNAAGKWNQSDDYVEELKEEIKEELIHPRNTHFEEIKET